MDPAALLLSVHEASPDALRDWLLRALDAAQMAFPELGRASSLELAIVVTWARTLSGKLTRDFFQTVLAHVQRLPMWLAVQDTTPSSARCRKS